MPFLPPNQQHQSTEGLNLTISQYKSKLLLLHLFSGLFSRTTWVSWYQKGKTSLNLNEARDDGVWRCSGISWTIRKRLLCKQPASRSEQITTPTAHHTFFMGRKLFPDAQPRVSVHWRQVKTDANILQGSAGCRRAILLNIFARCCPHVVKMNWEMFPKLVHSNSKWASWWTLLDAIAAAAAGRGTTGGAVTVVVQIHTPV